MFDFPSSPSIDQVYTSGGVSYRYNGYGWVITGSSTGSGNISVGDAPPVATDNTLWFETDSGMLWLRYNDGNSSQWVAVGGPATPSTGYYLPLSGGVLSGGLAIQPATGWAALTLASTAGNRNSIYGYRGSSLRWEMNLGNDVAEAGSNAGTDFNLHRFSDSGTYIDTLLAISRAGGNVTLTGGGVLNMSPASASPTINLNKPVGTYSNYLVGQRGGLIRWSITLGDGSAESTGNAGSNFAITRWNDAGSVIDVPFQINRATSVFGFGASASFASVVPSDSSTGCLFLGGNVYGGGIATNMYYVQGGGWKYIANGYAAVMASSGGGGWDFYGAASGTAGAAASIIRNISIGYYNNPIYLGPANCTINLGSAGGGLQYGIGIRCATDSTTAIMFSNAANTTIGSITTSATATAYNVSSDGGLKEDLRSFDAGSIIDSTKVYDFAWKTTGERAHGMVAQEAIEVYPEAVTHVDDEQMEWWGIDYSKYVPVLLQELKALRERVAALEGRAA